MLSKFRHRPLIFVAVLASVALLATAARAANPGTGTTTTGQPLNIQIASPTDGANVTAGTINVSGSTAIGPILNSANAYYMVDVSGSTASPSGLDCDGNGTPDEATDDLNGDTSVGDTLDCEISGVIALNGSLGSSAGVAAGLGAFSDDSANADVDPGATDALFASPPSADLNASNGADVTEVAKSMTGVPEIGLFTQRSAGGGGTDFDAAITAINTAFAGKANQANVAFLLTDGQASLTTGAGSPIDSAVAAGTTIQTFSVGGEATGCDPATSPLFTIADTTGGTCTEVTNPAQLKAALGGITPAGLQSVSVSVNGGAAVPATLDALGNWNADVTVASGSSTIAATVTATDGTTATASITVQTGPVVDPPPVANNQSITTNQDTAAPVTLTATDNGPLTYTVTAGPTHGTLSGTAPNLTYTPASGYTGPDSFSFTANDGVSTSNVGIVSITVKPVGPPIGGAPVADPQSVSTPKNNAVPITLTGSDPDFDTLTFATVSDPTNGTLSGTAPNLTYTPAADFTGTDAFTFTVTDGTQVSAPATVSITVTDSTKPPRCHFHGRHSRGEAWHVRKGHHWVHMSSGHHGAVVIVIYVNGRVFVKNLDDGADRILDIGSALRDSGDNSVSILVSGSRRDASADVSFDSGIY